MTQGNGAPLAPEEQDPGIVAWRSLVALCRTDFHAFAEFVIRDQTTDVPIEQAPMHVAMHEAIDSTGRVVIMAHPESGKALPLDTPIPTAFGFRKMGDLRVGDHVFDARGKPCRVTFVTPTMRDHVVYEIELDDGATIRADAEHRWIVRDAARYRGGRRDRSLLVRTTADFVAAPLRLSDGRFRWSLPVGGAVEFEPRPLPLPPYVLGAWLGDGDASSATLTFAEDDRFVFDRCVALVGGESNPRSDPRAPKTLRAIIGAGTGSGRETNRVRAQLRRMGLIGAKRIPREYLVAGVDDREELLAGLLDTDGSISNDGKSRVEFTNTNHALALDVLELVRSLGFKATIAEGVATIDGVEIGPKWRVSFTANRQVFRLPRKAARVVERERTDRIGFRHVVAVRRIESVPVRCISVDSEDRSYLAGREYVVTHNTSQIAIARVLWELGRDPTKQVAIIGNTQDAAKKTLSAIKLYIEKSEELRAVFPGLVPGKLWRDDKIEIARPTISKDPSIQCVGFHGQIVGSRVDIVVADDLLDYENTRTAYTRTDVSKWFRSSVMSRLSARAWVAFLTNAWHRDDLAHELERDGWKTLRFPVWDREKRPTWPERWPIERIRQSQIDMGPNDFARSFECKPRDDTAKIFPEEAIERCTKNGRGYRLVDFLDDDELEEGTIIVHGVDIATSRRATGAVSCVFTLLVHPNGERQPIAIRSGRWSAKELLSALRDAAERFGGVAVVEDNGAQKFVVDVAQNADEEIPIPVLPFATGRNKVDPVTGIEGMAAEFDAGRWIVPSGRDGKTLDPEIRAWLLELDDFDPATHAGDRLMASWMARTYALRRLRKRRPGVDDAGDVRVSVIG